VGAVSGELVPSPSLETGEAALDRLMIDAVRLRAAIAFVSRGGATILGELLSRHTNVETVTLVARGAPITEPDALLELRARGVAVEVIAGTAAAGFHPKVWLAEDASGAVSVLSGSGNLTRGGLRDNREQFELLGPLEGHDADAQRHRFESLVDGAIALDRFENSIAWHQWQRQLRRRAELEDKLRDMDAELAGSHPESRDADKRALLDDLWGIYNRTRDAKIRKADGTIYTPSGLRLELEGKRGETEPVKIACRLCRGETDGFDEMIKAGHPELTVEFLLVDADKPYHSLIPADIRAVSEERLREATR
jgi:HKD family nuclease